ncbi:hypothetical protein FACS1894199_15570 [Bacteroidia bacterium]|nr:hypothetical protein FACS1894199_15570 [Bacteroidia bacterium]
MRLINNKERAVISFDYALKRLLRHKADHTILEGFLSELLYRPIKVNAILESESNKENLLDKQNRVDLLAEDTDGELIIIELQYEHEHDFLLRMLYATSKSTTEHIHQGQKFGDIKKIYSINIIYFELGKGDDYIYHGTTQFIGIHTQKPLVLTKKQLNQFNKKTIADLFPEYYILSVNRFNDFAKDTLDEWIYYLKNDAVEDGFRAKGLKQVREQLDYDKLSLEEKLLYDKNREEVWKRDYDLLNKRMELGDLKEIISDLRKEKTQHEKVISESKEIISEKDKALAEQEKTLAKSKKIIADLQRQLKK